MRRTLSTLALATLVVAVAAAALAPATSGAAIRVGVSEQDLSVFEDPRFAALKVRRARVITPWNVALKRERVWLDQWLNAARAHRVQPFVSFSAATGSRCPKRPCRLPSVRGFRKAFRAFHRRYPWVRVVNPWNEANHRSQPTFRRPGRAAQFYNVVRRSCRRCQVVAADVIDERNMVPWLRRFRRYARGRPRLWGLHNYRDTNPRRGQRYGGTRRLLRSVRGRVWLTETGGIVKFVLPGGKTLFRRSEPRANRALRRMFRLAKATRRRVKRLYIYHWRQPSGRHRFDAGLVRANGRVRPGYRTVRRYLRGRWFAP